MPPVDGILETTLYVEDLERSLEFYQRIFGFGIVSAGDRLIALNVAPRQLLLLFKKRGSLDRPLTPHDGDGELHLTFAIPLAGLEAWEKWLGHHGIAIAEKRRWDLGGVSLYFRDPDGHLLEVATPGVWTSY